MRHSSRGPRKHTVAPTACDPLPFPLSRRFFFPFSVSSLMVTPVLLAEHSIEIGSSSSSLSLLEISPLPSSSVFLLGLKMKVATSNASRCLETVAWKASISAKLGRGPVSSFYYVCPLPPHRSLFPSSSGAGRVEPSSMSSSWARIPDVHSTSSAPSRPLDFW